eukprot:6458493-Amphidinium_carterae.1
MPYLAPYWVAVVACDSGAMEIETTTLLESSLLETTYELANAAGNVDSMKIHLDTGTQTIGVRPETLPEKYKKLFTEGSRLAEEKKLLPALTILSEREAANISKERVIPSRWLDTWKRQDQVAGESQYPKELGIPPGIIAKSRLIVLGFWDPDLPHLRVSSPTPESGEINIILAILAQQGVINLRHLWQMWQVHSIRVHQI